MVSTAAQARPPIAALAVAGYGAVLGSLFPLMAVMTGADISGGLSVAADSGALVNTSQNIGAVVGILIAPSFAAGIGRGRTMVLTGTGFVLASVACALAPSLGLMLLARFVHGVFGGVLPLLFMLLVMTSLRPGEGKFEGMTLFATSTTLFFGLAASVGALLVDTWGWRALFWAQAIAAGPYCIAASRVLTSEKGRQGVLGSTDWISHALLSFGLGLILIALSEGERHFWLEAWWIPAMLVGGTIFTAFAVYNLLTAARPLLTLAVFRRSTFSWAIALSLIFRFGSLFAIFIVPAYLGRIQGFRPAEIGEVLAWMTPAAAVSIVVAWAVARHWDTRWLLSAGLGCFALASYLCVGLGSEWAVEQLREAAAIAGFGMGLFAVAVLRYAVFGATMQDGPTVGVIFNLARVFGIVVGLAILSHLVAEREKFHSAILTERLAATDPETAQRLALSAGSFSRFSADAVAAQRDALAGLSRAAAGQAFTLAFADAFTVTAIALALGAILVWALPGIPAEVAPATRERSLA
ncbi:MFS transporter [Sphingomonas sp. RB3P16]|uniref:MFS transporter n=1 Tax=Parasphingomonas frigoris TaxID=3096163 RepID=UPI002FCBA755